MDFLADLKRLALLCRKLVQFTTRNNAFRLGANAYQNLRGTHAGDHARANLAGLRQINIQVLLF